MMTETMCDPYEILFGNEQRSLSSDGLLFTNEIMFSDFNTDLSSISPITNTTENTEDDFDPMLFEKILTELFPSDSSLLKESSIDLSFPIVESEPPTREMGTDPMEPTPSTLPIITTTPNGNLLTTKPILLIQSMNKPTADDIWSLATATIPTEYYNLQIEPSSLTTADYQMDDCLPLTPSTSSESPDEPSPNSPDSAQSSMLTNFDNLPATGPLVLTKEEVKLIKQEGYQVPTKLPLNKTEEKMLKKIRRKIKNKISAQESRRKKKEYVDALEKEIAKYVDENKALKQRMSVIEKNQKSITQERDVLRSMLGKGTPAPTTALMVFAVFFAVLFGVWSPITGKSSIDERALSLIPSHNDQSLATAQKSLLEQQDTTHSNHHKSRVLLSVDEHGQHQHHGPYLPSNNKYQSTFQQQTAAPGYTYSSTVEKYMNKKIQSEQKLKRSFGDDSSSVVLSEEPTFKKVRSNYHINENIVVIEETTAEMNAELNESKPVKIIRVERTVPAIGNDTLKLARRTMDE